MEEFIAEKIINARKISLEEGQAKYRVYFIKPSGILLYGKYKGLVDGILTTQEYGDCIVTQ